MPKTPDNLKPSPMTYTVERAVSLTAQRAALALQATDLTVDELDVRASEAQFDLAGAKTREEKVAAIREQAHGVEPVKEA